MKNKRNTFIVRDIFTVSWSQRKAVQLSSLKPELLEKIVPLRSDENHRNVAVLIP